MDIIETLLQTTGLSCDDLLNKLQEYRQSKSNESKKETDLSTDSQSSCSTSSRLVAQTENSDSVILAKDDQCIVHSTSDIEEKCVENVDKVESDEAHCVVEDAQNVENLEIAINVVEEKDSRVSSSQFDISAIDKKVPEKVEILETTVVIMEEPKSVESSSNSSAEHTKTVPEKVDILETTLVIMEEPKSVESSSNLSAENRKTVEEIETICTSDENSMVLPSHSDEFKYQENYQCVENLGKVDRTGEADKDFKFSLFHFNETQINVEATKNEENFGENMTIEEQNDVKVKSKSPAPDSENVKNTTFEQKDSKVSSYHSDEIQIDLEDPKHIEKSAADEDEQEIRFTLVCSNDREPVEILEKKLNVEEDQESSEVCLLQIDEINTLMKDTESTSNLDIQLDSANNVVEKESIADVNKSQFNFQEAEIFIVSKDVDVVREAKIEENMVQNVEPEKVVSPKELFVDTTDNFALGFVAVDQNISSKKETQCIDVELDEKIEERTVTKEDIYLTSENHKQADEGICSKHIFESCDEFIKDNSNENISSIEEALTETESQDKEQSISDDTCSVKSAMKVDETEKKLVIEKLNEEANSLCAMDPANDFDESSCNSEQNSLNIGDLLAKLKKNEDQEKTENEKIKEKIVDKLPESSEKNEKPNEQIEDEIKEDPLLPKTEIKSFHFTIDGKDDNSRQSSSFCDSQEDSNADSVEDSDITYTPHSEENLRNILKMQLSSLRNKKKTNLCLPDLKSRTKLFHNVKKKRKSCDVNAAIRGSLDSDEDKSEKSSVQSGKEENNEERKTDKIDISITEENRDDSINKDKEDTKDGYNEHIQNENKEVYKNEEKEGIPDEDSLVSLSEETNFMILNVTGGVDRLSPVLDKKENDSTLNSPKDDNSVCKDMLKLEEIDSEYNTPKLEEIDVPKLEIEIEDNVLKSEEMDSEPKELPRITINKSISENFSHDPGIKTTKNNEKSPFVSDSLDEFLSESSALKISYDIPKLNAEEGIKESTMETLFEDPVKKPEPLVSETSSKDKDKPKLVKAKTLADMRRQFEKLKAKEEKNAQEDQMRPKRKRKLKTFYGSDENTDAVEDVESIKHSITDTPFRNSYVIYENKILRVPSKGKPKCISVISSDASKEVIGEKPRSKSNVCTTNKKLTLLSCLNQNKKNKVTYKAGPLCKKATLQNMESKDNWCTEVKTLPKVYLEVIPEYRKKIDPKLLHLLPIFDDPIISKERVDFALTALESKDAISETKSFSFYVPYKNNQEHMLVRKFVEKSVTIEAVEEEKVPTTVIAKVLDDLITYVEIKELAPTLLKEDDVVFDATETNIVKKNRSKKRKKLDYELKRLSCKVIDLGTDEPDANCPKPYCKFGCVCKSLLCQSVFSNHCQLVECMFECKCTPGESTNLPALTHLEDQAKKDLAKVEKEFTQTIIHTDDDAILVGRGKSRRSSKVPKKYSDYVGEEIQSVIIPNVTQEVGKEKPCSLVIERLELQDVVPFCMVHNAYNCYCNGNSQFEGKRKIVKLNQEMQTSFSSSSLLPNCARLREVYSTYKERNKTEKYKKILKSNIVGNEEVLQVRMKNCENKFRIKRQGDSEMQGLDDKKHRRKQSFDVRQDIPPQNFALQRRKKQPVKNVKYNPVFDGEIRVPLNENKDMLRFLGQQKISVFSEFLRILPWRKLIQCYRDKTLNIWCDIEGKKLLCNRKGYFPPKQYMDIKDCPNKSEIIEWILTDRLPSKCPRDLMHMILTPKNIHFQISGYCLKKSAYAIDSPPKQSTSLSVIDVDSSIDSPENNLVYDSSGLTIEKVPSRGRFISINKLFDDKDDNATAQKLLKIRPQLGVTVNEPTQKRKSTDSKKVVRMKSILNNDKPNEMFATPINEGETIILDTSDYVTPEDEETEETVSKKRHNKDPLDISIEDLNKERMMVKRRKLPTQEAYNRKVEKPMTFQRSLLKSENDLVDPAATKILRCTHKDMNNENKVLAVFNYTFPRQKFFVEEKLDSFESEVTVALPVIGRNHRWRMIYLNSDFAFLLFTKSKYSIKYTDLMDVVNMSTNVKSTIALRNREFRCTYKHHLFGIFCVPTFTDRLFIGPYERTEDHGIETLRYLQGKLIDTEIFNTMIGRQIRRKYPSWIIPAILPTSQVIDVTDDKVVEVIDIDSDSGEEEESNVFQECLLCPPFVEELKKGEGGYTINRYIMTNVPYLGYFNGYQQHDKKTIDVYWPTGDRVFRFPNVTLAKHLLTLYLSHQFCPIPSNFKINVVIMTNLDLLQSAKPVDGKYFSNKCFYYCGDFGILGKQSLTDDICKKYNIESKASILKVFKEKKEDHEAITKIFGCFLMSNEELRTHATWESILKWAVSEIYILTRLSDYYESEHKELKNLIGKNTEILSKKRAERLKKKTNNVVVSETIEITDSEDEEPKNSNEQQVQGSLLKRKLVSDACSSLAEST